VSRADDLRRPLQPGRRPRVLQARPADHGMSVALREPGAVIETEPIRSRPGVVWGTIKRRPSAAIGAVTLLVVLAAAVLAPWIAPDGPHDRAGPRSGAPLWIHPLGWDDGGIAVDRLLMGCARPGL